ncbi:MAG: universal stress protein, partial [Dehalococcoidia bacterium]
MKVVLAVDGSRYSEAALNRVKALRIGRGAEVTLVTVIPEHVFSGGRTLTELLGRSVAIRSQLRKAEEEAASQLLAGLSKP